MKKKTIVLITALIGWCYLFYHQSAGINLLIFNVLLISGLLFSDLSLARSKTWIAAATGALITSAGALLYGSFLSCFGNVFALLILAGVSAERTSSLFFAFTRSVSSYVAMPFLFIAKIVDLSEGQEKQGDEAQKFTFGTFLKFFLPLVILVIFFGIYKNANPVFSKFVDGLKIDISWYFIGFLLLGLALVYGFLWQNVFGSYVAADQRLKNTLAGTNEKEFSLFTSLEKEIDAATLTFVLLNILLLLVNVLDIQFIISGENDSPEAYSSYVHQGIISSIFSVLIAIFVMLYFFRGNLNFAAKSKTVKFLALTWIILNAILLLTCFHKNFSYIEACGLTPKRIGVYFYLFLTFIGVITVWIKITGLKSNMFLVRMNTWSIFATLAFSTLFNWNKIILDHNVAHKALLEREYYLMTLPETSLPFLLENWKSLPTSYKRWDQHFEHYLNQQKALFIHKYKKAGWQSWNLEDERIYRAIEHARPARAK